MHARGNQTPLRCVFLDAGGTVFFPDTSRTLAPLHAAGFHPTVAQLYAAERLAKKQFDREILGGQDRASVDHHYWQTYYEQLLDSLGAGRELVGPCIAATCRSDHWSQLADGARTTLEQLRARGLRLGVISNSDGRIAQRFHEAGIGDLFDGFSDSGLVGREKPAPEIFLHALDSLRAAPGESLYVGDIYSLDYLGARNAGLNALLLDAAGAYRDDGVPRIETLGELPAWITAQNLVRA
jgi:putative hydrolase of the HAD superfamily